MPSARLAKFCTKGSVWWVADSALNMPPDSSRTVVHDGRPVVVVSTDLKNQDSAFPVVSVCPISTSEARQFSTQYDLHLDRGEGNLSNESWVRTTLIQPMDKDKLDDYKGKLNDNRILELDDLIIDYLGML